MTFGLPSSILMGMMTTVDTNTYMINRVRDLEQQNADLVAALSEAPLPPGEITRRMPDAMNDWIETYIQWYDQTQQQALAKEE